MKDVTSGVARAETSSNLGRESGIVMEFQICCDVTCRREKITSVRRMVNEERLIV